LYLINEDKYIIEHVNQLSMHFTSIFSMRFDVLTSHSKFFQNSRCLPLGTVTVLKKNFKSNLILSKLGARGYGK